MSEVAEKAPTHNEIIDSFINKLQSNNFTINFYTPPMSSPSGGMGVLFRLARHLKDNGFNVKMVYEPQMDQKASFEQSRKLGKQVRVFNKLEPTWLDFDVSDIEMSPLGDEEITFSSGEKSKTSLLIVNPEDFLIIPEGFPDVMKKTAQVTCKRIVLAQSWFYVLNGMNVGETWQSFGIKDVISVSDAITEYLNVVMPGLNIKQFAQGIDRQTFKAPEKSSDKFPMIGFTASRGQESRMKIFNMIKTFYAFYPHYRWVRFVELSNLSRKEFAERLATCAIVLNADDIAGFGTLPLEAMATGTHVVAWANYGGKEYMNENNGFWATSGDVFQTAEILGVAMNKWLNGELDSQDVKNAYETTLAKYEMGNEISQFLNIINEYKNERINEISALKK